MEEKKVTIEEELREIEAIIDRLDHGDLDLSGALEAYEQGIRRVRSAEKLLEDADKQLKILSEEGNEDEV